MSTSSNTTTTSSSAQKRVSLEGGDEQNQIANAQGEQSRKRCKQDEVEKQAISPDSAKNETTNDDPQAESDNDADSAKSETTNDPQAETDNDDDEDTKTPRTDKEEIIYIVAKRLWSDDFEDTAAALVSFCNLTKPDHSNSDEHLKTAFIHGAPVLIARAMSMNRTYYEIQKHGCIALARLANSKIDNAQQVIVDIGGLKLCRRAADRYEYCHIIQVSVCKLIGYLLECPHVREHAVTEGPPTVLEIMNNHKKDASVLREGCHTLYLLVKQNPQLKEAVGEGRAIECVISAMEKFPKDAGIQKYGCKFLTSLHTGYRELIIEAKGLVMVAEAGRIHKDNQSVLLAARHANQVLFF